jgi:cytochrome c oxidase assembly factor CtaG
VSPEEAAFWHWHGRPDVLLVLGLLGVTYGAGWRRLRGRPGDPTLATGWRLAAYASGLGSIALALLSPIDHLAESLLSAHMVQHQLLIMVAAPLVLLGNPWPFVVWGLPAGARRRAGPALARQGALRRALRWLTWMPVAGGLYTVTLWGWHVPGAYQAALRHGVVHDVEHLTFFLTAVLFWWPIVNPAPREAGARGGAFYGLRIGYLILATAQNTLLGSVIGLTERVLYPVYATAPRLFGLSPLDDQSLAGGIMWSGSHMYLIALLALVGQAVSAEHRAAPHRA